MADIATKLITLISSDGEEFMVPKVVAKESQTICHLIEDDYAKDSIIPLPNIKSIILSKVIEYCMKHVSKPEVTDEELKKWDEEYLDIDLDLNMLYELIVAANYLNIKGLLDLTCRKVADMIKGRSQKDIRKIFNIENDFTPEEKEEIQRENSWAFE